MKSAELLLLKTNSDALSYLKFPLKGKRAYPCEWCEQSFEYEKNLIGHLMGPLGHNGWTNKKFRRFPNGRKIVPDDFDLNPYKCACCTKTYKEKRLLIKHYKKMHSTIDISILNKKCRSRASFVLKDGKLTYGNTLGPIVYI
jgi:uncharacterized C2H2 Zn-finger protein